MRLHCWAFVVLFALLGRRAARAEPVRLDLGGGTVLTFATPAPVLWQGAPLPEPAFDDRGDATVSGLALQRMIEKIDGGYRIRLAVTNRRAQPVELKLLVPLEANGANGLKVAGTTLPSWQVFRLARQKNDIPGPFRPTKIDDASRDAATESLEGRSDDPAEAAKAGVRFHSDPGLVVLPDDRPDTADLFIGFDGQTEHLSDIAIELDRSRQTLAKITAQAEFDGAVLAPGATRSTHWLYLQTGKSCPALLADHVARIKARYGARLADKRDVFCTWYFYGPEIVADDLRRDLAELKRRPIDFELFLIDYGWSDDFGDWTPNPARFPAGMKAMADEIKAAGLTPGIWTCPFLLAPDSQALRAHPDLALKTRSGSAVEFRMNGIGAGRFYVVDPTAPSAREHLLGLCRKLKGWGYDYLKFDFLRGVVAREDAVFYDRTMDRAQAYRRAMEILREGAGDSLIGAWGGLYEANAGIVNINRSGSDVRGHWDPVGNYNYGTRYPVRMRQTFARSCYDETLWTSDQDALQVRRRTTPWRTAKPHLAMGVFTDEEAFSTVVYRFLGGGMVQVSDKLDEVDQDRYDLYKMVIPTYAPVAERFGRWEDYLPEYFVSHFTGGGGLTPWAVVSLCNWNGKAPKTLSFRLRDVPGLPPADTYAAFEFRTQRFLGVFRPDERISMPLGIHAARVIRLTPIAGSGPWLIGTDLNMSCGMEIESLRGGAVALREPERKFPAKFIFLLSSAGQVTTQVVEHQPE